MPPTPQMTTPTSTAETTVDPATRWQALRRITELEQEVELLGKASAYFAAKSQRAQPSGSSSRSIDGSLRSR